MSRIDSEIIAKEVEDWKSVHEIDFWRMATWKNKYQ